MTSPTMDRRYGVNGSIAIKAPARLATTANITLNGLQSIDGVTTVAGDRVLVKDQTSAIENGVYVADSGDWTRDIDFDGNRDIVTGTQIFVTAGSTNINTYWKVTAANPITIGTTSLTIEFAAVNDSAMVGYTPAGTGAVTTTAQAKLRENVSVFDFFTTAQIADVRAGTQLLDVTVPVQAAFDYMATLGGGTLLFPPGEYYFGQHATSVAIVTASGMSNVEISGYGALCVVDTTAESTPFLFVFEDCDNVVLRGFRFFDSGFDPLSWLTHARWGMGAVALSATATPRRGFKMEDCYGENMTYLLVSDQRANKRNISDIQVVDCRAKNMYYGVDLIYAGNNCKVDNLICEDVRRGFISYGPRNADVDIKLYTTEGFNGSTGFINIACEGETYDDTAVGGVGVIGTNANVENIRIRLNVTGFEAHENYVKLNHQQADSAGYIKNVDIDVKINNLDATGKDVALGDTNAVILEHELPSTAIQNPTTRKYQQIRIQGGIIGTITGVPLVVTSYHATDFHTIALCPVMTPLVQVLTFETLTTYITWLTPFELPWTGLVPVGASTAGTATNLVSECTYTVINKRVTFNAFMSWTGHTGTGALRISGLPVAINKTAPSGDAPFISIGGALTHTANTTLLGLAGGAADKQILIYEENGGVTATVAVDATVAGIYLSGSYLGV